MGPLILVGAVAVVAVLGWRGVRKQHQKVLDALKRAEKAVDRKAPMTLEQDPRTGVYRPRRED
jgi:hypothetical protein